MLTITLDDRPRPVIQRLVEVVSSAEFARYPKILGAEVQKQLGTLYAMTPGNSPKEIDLFTAIVKAVNMRRDFTAANWPPFTIRSMALRIHGNKRATVQYEQYGQLVNPNPELGDVLLIVQGVFRDHKEFEVACITQFKTGNKLKEWNLQNHQFLLLSRFPSFEGVGKLLRGKKYSLPDFSGCLGNIGLFYAPGDFLIAGAREVERAIWPSDTSTTSFQLTAARVRQLLNSESPPVLNDYEALSTPRACANSLDFFDKVLRFQYGERTIWPEGIVNTAAHELLADIIRVCGSYSRHSTIGAGVDPQELAIAYFGEQTRTPTSEQGIDITLNGDDNNGFTILLFVIDFGD